MAHMAKYKMAAVAPMLDHYERVAETERGYRRDNIDFERTVLNYTIGAAGDSRQAVADAVERHEAVTGKALRKDANVLVDWVVTLPEDCPDDRAEDFFVAVVDFVRARYAGEVIGGWVHMDEARPHIHIALLPVIDGKLQSSKMVNRADLRTFHADLGHAVDAALGFHVSIELGEEQKVKKALSKLDQTEYKAAVAELERIERETDAGFQRLEEVRQSVEDAESFAEAKAGDLANLPTKREAAAEQRRLEAESLDLANRLGRLEGELAVAREEAVHVRQDSKAAGRRVERAFTRIAGNDGRNEVIAGDVLKRLVLFLLRRFTTVDDVRQAVRQRIQRGDERRSATFSPQNAIVIPERGRKGR